MSLVTDLQSSLKETYTINKASKTRLSFDGAITTKSELQSLITPDFVEKYSLLQYAMLPDREKKDVCSAVYETLLAESKYVRKEVVDDVTGVTADTSSLTLCSWVDTGEKFVFDTALNEVSDLNYKAFMASLSRSEQNDLGELIPFYSRGYDPYDISKTKQITMGRIAVTEINTYIPPEWRVITFESGFEPIIMPQVFERFFTLLFPDDAVREYVYNWLHYAILYRNETILTINGVKGIGKGLFSSILKGLVGAKNYTEAPISALTSQFNAMLDSNRMIVFDEIEVDKKAHTKLKRYVNRDQNIEKKGVDAVRAVETYNNLVITNNDKSDMYVEVDDRRFSILDCTDKPLKESLTLTEMREILKASEDVHTIGCLGEWLIKYGKSEKYDQFSAWKGPTFYKLAYSSLALWQKYLVDLCCNAQDDEPIYYNSLKKAFKKETNGNLPSNMSKVEDFLANYYHLGEHKVATLEKDEGEYVICPTLEILGKSTFFDSNCTEEMLDCL